MAVPAERTKAMRERRRARGLRLVIPDARATAVRQRVADQVARLQPASEDDALRWIEAVAATDDPATS